MSTLKYLMALVAMMATVIQESLLAVVAIPAIVKAEELITSKVNLIHPVLRFIIPVVQAATSRDASRKTATRSGVKNTGVHGTKTREGNVRALALRTNVNMAARNKSANTALKYGHRAIQAQRTHAYAMRDLMATGSSLNCGIKAKKRSLMGTGFLAKDVKKQSYRAIAVGCRGTFTVKAVRVSRPFVRPTKAQIEAGKKAARLQSFHSWVIAQDGGWVSKSGKVRLAALQQVAA